MYIEILNVDGNQYLAPSNNIISLEYSLTTESVEIEKETFSLLVTTMKLIYANDTAIELKWQNLNINNPISPTGQSLTTEAALRYAINKTISESIQTNSVETLQFWDLTLTGNTALKVNEYKVIPSGGTVDGGFILLEDA